MTTILYIEVSPRGAESWSRRIGAELLARLERRHPAARVVRRDLAANPPPAIDAAFANAILRRPEEWTAADRDALGYSEQVIGELEAADVVVIATPMNNYTVPATLKTWIDHVVRIRRTFVGTPQGKVGLLRDRPTYIVTVAGGYHAGEEALQPDFLTPYLRAILATIGIHDVRFLTLQGITRGRKRSRLPRKPRVPRWMHGCEGRPLPGQRSNGPHGRWHRHPEGAEGAGGGAAAPGRGRAAGRRWPPTRASTVADIPCSARPREARCATTAMSTSWSTSPSPRH